MRMQKQKKQNRANGRLTRKPTKHVVRSCFAHKFQNTENGTHTPSPSRTLLHHGICLFLCYLNWIQCEKKFEQKENQKIVNSCNYIGAYKHRIENNQFAIVRETDASARRQLNNKRFRMVFSMGFFCSTLISIEFIYIHLLKRANDIG